MKSIYAKENNPTLVLASNRPWFKHKAQSLAQTLNLNCVLIQDKKDLNLEHLRNLSPKFIFIPHWSYKIPPEVYEEFCCVMFHMTDLPFGRGGSPLQNLISRGFEKTQVSAFICEEEMDAGPILLKKELSLMGTAEEIFIRFSELTIKMIEEIYKTSPQAQVQEGEVTHFTRRTSAQSQIPQVQNLEELYNHIRMLDAEGYPRAFIEYCGLKLEFSRASLKVDHLVADVKISLNEAPL